MSADAMTLYEALYRLASMDVESDLFGTNAPLAQEAFRRASAGASMPIVWFEIPLSGTPRFDLHVAHGNADLHEHAPFASDAMDGYGNLLNWYSSEPREGGGLALAYDVGDGRISDPAIHANVNGAGSFDAEGFFARVGRTDAVALYEGFARQLPKGWRIWYFGVHQGRPGTPVRIDCFVDNRMKAAYASVPSLLETHLRDCGFMAASAALRDLAGLVTRSPFALELQFDVLPDGSVGPTIGVSAAFPSAPSKLKSLFEAGGTAAGLMGQIERRSLADARWRLIPEATFAKLVKTDDGPLVLYCAPTFVKLRVRGGELLDAKVYLQAGTR